MPPPEDDDVSSSALGARRPVPTVTVTDRVDELARAFASQLERALGVRLDGGRESLAFVDHHLATARDEDREPILLLLAASAGAYYGELVRRTVGGTWVGQDDPRSFRLLLAPHLVFFSPVDQAYLAILGETPAEDDPRAPRGAGLDGSFHVADAPAEPGATDPERVDDESWLVDRLAELAPVPEDQFHSLTARFETLELVLELLSARHASEGRTPRTHGVEDYVAAMGD